VLEVFLSRGLECSLRDERGSFPVTGGTPIKFPVMPGYTNVIRIVPAALPCRTLLRPWS